MTMRKAEPFHYAYVVSPVGPLLVAGSDAGLSLINFQTGRHVQQPEAAWVEDRAPFEEAIAQLSSYFDGTLQRFELKLAPRGTPSARGLAEAAGGPRRDDLTAIVARRVGTPRCARGRRRQRTDPLPPSSLPRVIGQQGS
jgi:methylated-DNA-[protein]-cysteine S-methyltransferase